MKKIVLSLFLFFFTFVAFSQITVKRSVFEEGNVLYFDGEGDYVDLGNSVGNEVRTIEMWFKLDSEVNPFIDEFISLTARETALTNENEFSLSFLPNFKGHPGHLRFNITEALGQEYSVYSDSDKWLADEWHHVAAVVHPQMGMMLFIDGIKQNSTNTFTQAPVENNHITTLGCWGDLNNRYYKGSMDDVRFSDEALYIDDFEPPCPDQIALPSTLGLWNFNNDYNNIASDISGHGQDGIVYGARWVYDSICSVSSIQGNALLFDGEGDYVDLGNSVGNEVRTIEMWFKLDSEVNPFIDEFISLTARETALTNENEFSLSFLPNFKGHPGHLRFNITEALGQEYSVYSDSDKWLADEWHHVAAVVHPQMGMMLFIDGIKQNSTNTFTQAPVENNHITTLGCWGDLNNRYYKGSMDDVRFSDEALYIDDFEPPCPDQIVLPSTLGLWDFNNDYDNIATDISGHGQDGIVYGARWVYDSICSVSFIQGNALLFDGDDYVDLGSQAGIGVRTIELWFSPSEDIGINNTKFITLIAREGGDNNENEFDISLLPDYKSMFGKLEFGISDPYGEKHVVSSKSKKWEIDNWYHIAAVVHPRDGMMLFVDGRKQENTNTYQESTQESKYITTLASWGLLNGMYFSGRMEDVRFSNKALYSNDFIPQCPDLEVLPSTIGLWGFNGSRDIAKDMSANNYDGRIYGAERIMVDVCEDYHPDYNNTEDEHSDDIVRININPSKDIFEFIFNDDISFSSKYIKIYTSKGSFVLSQKISADTEYVDLTNVQPGVYYYHIVNSNIVVGTGKLVKL